MKKAVFEMSVKELEAVVDSFMSKRVVYDKVAEIEELYIDWCNNFLTIDRFAEYYSISKEKAMNIIILGRKINRKWPEIFDYRVKNESYREWIASKEEFSL